MSELALGLSLGLGAGLAPGPLQVLVVQATLAHGFAAGARVAAAPLLSDLPIVVLCTLVLRELSDEALAAISLAGAALRRVARMGRAAGAGRDAGRREPGRRARGRGERAEPPPVAVLGDGRRAAARRRRARSRPPLAVAFVAGFYLTLIGAKVGLAALVEAGRRRGRGRLVPRAVSCARRRSRRRSSASGGTRVAVGRPARRRVGRAADRRRQHDFPEDRNGYRLPIYGV